MDHGQPGPVWGVELDNDPNPNIYITSTALFFGPATAREEN